MIFKKYISILLTVLLLVSNLGLAFNVHYCENQIASVTLDTAQSLRKAESGCCGELEKESKCCNDKIIKAEIKSDQIIVKSLSFEAAFIPVAYDWKPVVWSPKINFTQRDNFTYYCDANAPPLYLLYSQYTFYA
ncbi:HYC_CC_PP family protein [Flavobacterium sp. XGLA_31]|uniref:HYC_CC_PP family protein n=1 Tax=Flavobacterium sp. XGLA_31 TaxID=3447666 RepID=UPI003F35B055